MCSFLEAIDSQHSFRRVFVGPTAISHFAPKNVARRMPHPFTLGKIITCCGPAVIDEQNGTLLVKAAGKR